MSIQDGEEFKRRVMAVIETTGDPTAPIRLQELAGALSAVGKMLTSQTSKEEVSDLTLKFLEGFPDEDALEKLCVTPCFVVTLCAMLHQALTDYVGNLKVKS